MNNHEAINVLFNEWRCIDRNDGIHCDRKCESCDLVMDVEIIREAYNMAISALEKQIPKRAVGKHYAHMRCPSCNHRIPSGGGSSSKRRDNWCNYCGQAIDWED